MFTIVNRWANKLTVNLLALLGASQETLNKVAAGLADSETGRQDALTASAPAPDWFNWFKVGVIFVVLGAVAYGLMQIYKLITVKK